MAAQSLTLREKLALTHTSMSQRQMAAAMGVSPRTVGRWLRAGSPEGVKAIPAEAAPLVNIVFDVHRDLAKQAARTFGIPFTPLNPVFARREPLRTGELGDRVFVRNAQFLGPSLRPLVIFDFAASGKFVVASVGSIIDFARYYETAVENAIEEERKKPRGRSRRMLAQLIADGIKKAFGTDPRGIALNTDIRPLCTPKEAIGIQFNYAKGIERIEERIRYRHEPAASGPGTAVGNVLIMQMAREHAIKANDRITPRKAARNRKRRT